MKNKNQLIGCCGLDCETCDARIATITNDNALREKTALIDQVERMMPPATFPDIYYEIGAPKEELTIRTANIVWRIVDI